MDQLITSLEFNEHVSMGGESEIIMVHKYGKGFIWQGSSMIKVKIMYAPY